MVSVDQSEPVFDPALVARAHRAVEPLHAQLYFAPEHDERFSGARAEARPDELLRRAGGADGRRRCRVS